MDAKKLKDGVSVKEIESFAKKHRFALFFSLALLLSCLFNFVFFVGWSMVFGAAGGILGALFPQRIQGIFQGASCFFRKQEDLTQLVLTIVGLILAVFLPVLTFLVLGAAGGKYFQSLACCCGHEKKEADIEVAETEETEDKE
jgi:hypothetical protein